VSEILLIRHGATDWNEGGLIQGRTDRPLSAAGREQVRRMRLPLQWLHARCLASPLRRAMETARLLGIQPAPEPRLVEMSWGDWEGKSLAELRATLGDCMAENERRGLDFRPPGGESPREVQARLRPLLCEIREPTVFVTHKGVLRALYALASGWTMQEKPPHKLLDGCAHRFTVSAGEAMVGELNLPLPRVG
jgi:probable phosphoglycerate mutase